MRTSPGNSFSTLKVTCNSCQSRVSSNSWCAALSHGPALRSMSRPTFTGSFSARAITAGTCSSCPSRRPQSSGQTALPNSLPPPPSTTRYTVPPAHPDHPRRTGTPFFRPCPASNLPAPISKLGLAKKFFGLFAHPGAEQTQETRPQPEASFKRGLGPGRSLFDRDGTGMLLGYSFVLERFVLSGAGPAGRRRCPVARLPRGLSGLTRAPDIHPALGQRPVLGGAMARISLARPWQAGAALVWPESAATRAANCRARSGRPPRPCPRRRRARCRPQSRKTLRLAAARAPPKPGCELQVSLDSRPGLCHVLDHLLQTARSHRPPFSLLFCSNCFSTQVTTLLGVGLPSPPCPRRPGCTGTGRVPACFA